VPRSNTKTYTASDSQGAVFITAAQLRERFGGMSHMFIERLLKRDPNFPRPVTLAGSMFRFWKLDDVIEWERRAVKQSA
jgi:predicted DNA-binding transcriptional regulator AlpA